MSDSKKRGLRSYHGNYANYQYDESGKKKCYFNPRINIKDIKFSEFRYLKKKLACNPAKRLPETPETIANLRALGDALVDPAVCEEHGHGNSSIPTGYTYWGQFIDHDITAGTDRSHEFTITEPDFSPVPPDDVERDIVNQRIPFLDLDSVYGDARGPFGSQAFLYGYDDDPVKLRIGFNDPATGGLPDPELGAERDLPRNLDRAAFPELPETIATIGDLRNDENLIVAQFHLAFLKFHNALVDAVRDEHPNWDDERVFVEARRQMRFHHQWLIVNDFLPRVCGHEQVDLALDASSIFDEDEVFMPLEFATAAYRFGHSMVRNAYDHNRNFGRGPNSITNRASFVQLFAFTGKGAINNDRFDRTLPENWVIEWNRFFDTTGEERDDNGILITDRFTRDIDTFLAEPLSDMANEDADFLSEEERENLPTSPDEFNEIMKHLARRNLLRGYLLSMPTGQALAKAFHVPALTMDELTQGNSDALNMLLFSSGFLETTPLWFYILKEAEVKAGGEHLGPLGGFIVARTIVGLLKSDPNSYLNYCDEEDYGKPWEPADGPVERLTETRFRGIMDLLRFARVALPIPVEAHA